jgi:SAM-dependent methyltransferase
MANYADIYNQVFDHHAAYQSPIYSPGVRLCMLHRERIKSLGRRHIDVGCGAGFVVELLKCGLFNKESVGVDVSPRMVEETNSRVSIGSAHLIADGRAPFPDGQFDLVTCFDVLEHLDEADIPAFRDELFRLTGDGGTLLCNISLRPAAIVDHNGENLHRTIRSHGWWDQLFAFDEFTFVKEDMEMTAWKRVANQLLPESRMTR